MNPMEDICVVDVYHGKVLFVTSLSVKGAGLVNFRLQVVFPVTCKKNENDICGPEGF